MSEERGTLKVGEVHPAAYHAAEYIRGLDFKDKCMLADSMASCSIEGNRVGEVCGETYRRFSNGEPVSDRYIMGLALFFMKCRGEL